MRYESENVYRYWKWSEETNFIVFLIVEDLIDESGG